MCADEACLALRLEAPLQSWGSSARFNFRGTDAFPTRSAVLGMLCAALGLPRNSDEERAWLGRCAPLRMKAVAISRARRGKALPAARVEDFHTVSGVTTADGKPRGKKGVGDTLVTRRHYLADASFFVFLTGDVEVLGRLAEALKDPVWGLWLGRKSCVPAAPVFAGFHATLEEAEVACLPEGGARAWAEDAPSFVEGSDDVMDVPLSFAFSNRRFRPRRIRKGHMNGKKQDLS